MSDHIVRTNAKTADATTQLPIVDWLSTIWVVGVHLLALLVFVPWFFSWTGVVPLFLHVFQFGLETRANTGRLRRVVLFPSLE